MNQFETLIQTCDQNIRHGRASEAVRRLHGLRTDKVPRQWRLPLAKICRRAGLYPLGLRLLSKLMFPKRGGTPEPTASEVAEYAVLLLRSGATAEAIERLSSIDVQQAPEALLFRAYGHLTQWECFEAIVQLEHYLKYPLAPPVLLVGRTNLAIAFVESRQHERAIALIEENIEMAKEQNHLHLERYHQALSSQVYLQEGEFAKARQKIELAHPRSEPPHSHDELFITKLRLILDGLENRDLAPLHKLRELAVAKNDWIAFREADLFSLKVEFNLAQFLHLYFGSPLRGFRDNIKLEFGRAPEREIYVLGAKSAPRFDLRTGEIGGDGVTIRAGGENHQLIDILLRDFYQPLRIAEMHSALFPTEYFNINSSPGRVHQILNRTRKWIEKNQIPIAINEKDGFYSLAITGDFSFRIPLNRKPIDTFHIRVEQLRSEFKSQGFSSSQAQDKLQLSSMTTHRLLVKAANAGILEKTAKGNSHEYRFAA